MKQIGMYIAALLAIGMFIFEFIEDIQYIFSTLSGIYHWIIDLFN